MLDDKLSQMVDAYGKEGTNGCTHLVGQLVAKVVELEFRLASAAVSSVVGT